jgi:hypothetical protein
MCCNASFWSLSSSSLLYSHPLSFYCVNKVHTPVGGLKIQHESYDEIIALLLKLHWLIMLRQNLFFVIFQVPSKLFFQLLLINW